ncbi:tetratricopeptide repeat protein [Clostridium gasigenes]|uniref:tetratricopeptide repeat protein n=1 Tax=Clostridium gasigenes TaxID=94869 RepID=UPI001C0B4535|nr:Ig-like domain-containing protein [Clostridium gasigenes]MBU3108850.1 Ig-like domain-containing protein [Clostridium gasigenes]
MNKKFKTKNLSILLSLLLISTLISCNKIDKETILSRNVTEDIKIEENEVKVTLEKGHDYLNNNDFANAKLTYEKAISIDKVNKDIYLEIKDKYLELTRFDDALYFVQLALNNNTDVDNMKIISDSIKSNFETATINKSLYEGDAYTLPSELTTKINNEDISVPITWNNSVINTSNAGTFSYSGVNKEYSRQFTATLTVSPAVFDEKYCYVKNIYKSNGKTFIDVDLVEFFRDDKAIEESKKDNINIAISMTEDGSGFIYSDHYIRNNLINLTTYDVSEKSIFNLLSYEINQETINSNDTSTVTYDKFESYINSHANISDSKNPRPLLCIIKLKDNVVYDISRTFTP